MVGTGKGLVVLGCTCKGARSTPVSPAGVLFCQLSDELMRDMLPNDLENLLNHG